MHMRLAITLVLSGIAGYAIRQIEKSWMRR
jgi:hypothetical protein